MAAAQRRDFPLALVIAGSVVLHTLFDLLLQMGKTRFVALIIIRHTIQLQRSAVYVLLGGCYFSPQRC